MDPSFSLVIDRSQLNSGDVGLQSRQSFEKLSEDGCNRSKNVG